MEQEHPEDKSMMEGEAPTFDQARAGASSLEKEQELGSGDGMFIVDRMPNQVGQRTKIA